MKKIGAEAILTVIVAPLLIGFLFWFAGFVISTYSIMAEVTNSKGDIQEIKQDVKEIKSFLLKGKINE